MMVRSERASAVVRLEFGSAREAEAVRRALAPEEELPATSRCRAKIFRRENDLFLQVDAKDTAALRAALNSFIRWAIVARDMLEPRRKRDG
ncbi:MAG: KEOPS complex subunit Pcc1 [Candidatus Hadarchaeum sp.]|uniref:KEOPS complex subunit Pcc1 n=1 Tax=Candidatus Hadarchaeum sp. TaxID=2883567 RepID=UPI003D12097A